MLNTKYSLLIFVFYINNMSFQAQLELKPIAYAKFYSSTKFHTF